MAAGKGKPTDRQTDTRARQGRRHGMAEHGRLAYIYDADSHRLTARLAHRQAHKGAGKGAERRARASPQIALPGRARAQGKGKGAETARHGFPGSKPCCNILKTKENIFLVTSKKKR